MCKLNFGCEKFAGGLHMSKMRLTEFNKQLIEFCEPAPVFSIGKSANSLLNLERR